MLEEYVGDIRRFGSQGLSSCFDVYGGNAMEFEEEQFFHQSKNVNVVLLDFVDGIS